MMALQCYDFELIYTPGKYIVLADALSRAPAPNSDAIASPTTEDAEAHVNMNTIIEDAIWLQAIKRTDWTNTTFLNSCPCSAHFISGSIGRQRGLKLPASPL